MFELGTQYPDGERLYKDDFKHEEVFRIEREGVIAVVLDNGDVRWITKPFFVGIRIYDNEIGLDDYAFYPIRDESTLTEEEKICMEYEKRFVYLMMKDVQRARASVFGFDITDVEHLNITDWLRKQRRY